MLAPERTATGTAAGTAAAPAPAPAPGLFVLGCDGSTRPVLACDAERSGKYGFGKYSFAAAALRYRYITVVKHRWLSRQHPKLYVQLLGNEEGAVDTTPLNAPVSELLGTPIFGRVLVAGLVQSREPEEDAGWGEEPVGLDLLCSELAKRQEDVLLPMVSPPDKPLEERVRDLLRLLQ